MSLPSWQGLGEIIMTERRKKGKRRNNANSYIKVATLVGVAQIFLIIISLFLQLYTNQKIFAEVEDLKTLMSLKQLTDINRVESFSNIFVVVSLLIMALAFLLLWFNLELMHRFKNDMSRQNKAEGCIDELTGVWNRKYIDKYLARYIKKNGSGFLYMCDMDNFKKINDTLGHDAGDQVLKDFASVLKSALREEDRICRLGGDEFMLYVPSIDEATAKIVYERIRDMLAKKLAGSARSIVTISCGATPINDARNFTEDYKRADQALYYVKEAGKNSFCILI